MNQEKRRLKQNIKRSKQELAAAQSIKDKTEEYYKHAKKDLHKEVDFFAPRKACIQTVTRTRLALEFCYYFRFFANEPSPACASCVHRYDYIYFINKKNKYLNAIDELDKHKVEVVAAEHSLNDYKKQRWQRFVKKVFGR